MSVTPGVRLGPYEITAAIGAGGMGEVYRARDTKLGRDIAIKVLPDAFACDPERVARFQREARTLASLNHPNIAAIYGLEEAGNIKALVLELVEGPTLADRIAQGPLPVDEAVSIAREIAEALEAAHELGIIHRDLKPANIKLRSDGTVKVLDFGLAKAVDETAGSGLRGAERSQSPTITSPVMTLGGVLLGTAAYMAPEQARGKPVDKRADIWAFGCVVYEMLTGKRAFEGEDVSLTLAAIMKSEPDLAALPDGLSPAVRSCLARCLQKDPKQRARDMGDVRLALDGGFDTARSALGVVPTTTKRLQLWQQPLPASFIAMSLIAAGALAVWSVTSPPQSTQQPVRRMAINTSETAPFLGQGMALSPDGRQLVYAALDKNGRPQLYIRALDQLDAHPLPGTEGARHPFFSPDGEWIAFFKQGGAGPTRITLQKIPVRGGSPLTLCDTPYQNGGTWAPDGTIVFASGSGARHIQLWRIPSGGGIPQPLEATNEETPPRGWPQILPDGNTVLFTVFDGRTARIEALSLETGASRRIVDRGHYGRYLPTGHLVFMSDATLMAVPFDIERLSVAGSPTPVLEGIRTVMPIAATALVIGSDGTLVYQPGASTLQGVLGGNVVVVTRDGRTTPVVATSGSDMWPRLSPDDQQVAVFAPDFSVGRAQNTDVWVYDLNRGTRDKVTTHAAEDSYFTWTRDGARIVFLSTRTGAGDLYWKRLFDRSGPEEPLLKGDTRKVPGSWSPDGKILGFYEIGSKGDRDIWTLPVGGTPGPFIATAADELAPAFSPNGRWMAYVSDENGQREVFVQPYPGPGGRIPISTDGGEGPQWSHDGRELFYFRRQSTLSGQLMAVDIKEGPAMSVGVPRVVFDGPYLPQGNGNPNYDVFRDGKRFVMIQRASAGAPEPPLVVVFNWFEELKRLVPAN